MPGIDKTRVGQIILSLIPSLLIVSIFALPRILDNGLTAGEVVIDVLCVATFTSIFSRIFDSRTRGAINDILDIYDDRCDPAAFVEQAKPYVEKLKEPYDEYGVWLATPYAMALIDLGRLDEAKSYASKVLEGGKSGASSYSRASMLVTMEPLVSSVFGIDSALQLLDEAQKLVEEEIASTKGKALAQGTSRNDYIQWRKDLLEAFRAGDDNKTISLLKDVRTRGGFSWRLRVLCAIDEASVYYRRGDLSRERDCLDFVVEHGNRLPCVAVAQSRLNQMGNV